MVIGGAEAASQAMQADGDGRVAVVVVAAERRFGRDMIENSDQAGERTGGRARHIILLSSYQLSRARGRIGSSYVDDDEQSIGVGLISWGYPRAAGR